MDFVGLTFKERVIEFLLIVSGAIFYHLFLRPVEFFKNLGKDKAPDHASPSQDRVSG